MKNKSSSFYGVSFYSGGRDRYLLNSRIAQVKEIRDFFQCCQLNINNPHFMIQQGQEEDLLSRPVAAINT